MGRYLARRGLQFIPVFFGATMLIHALVFIMPGDPIRALAGERFMAATVRQELRDRYNLDDPWHIQYGKYLTGVFQGDLGEDFRGREVRTIIFEERIWRTIRLASLAFVFEVVIGIVAGVLAGVRKGGFVDNLVLVSTLVVIAIPIFVLGFIAQLVLGVELGWFPVAGIQRGPQIVVIPQERVGLVNQ